MPLQPGRYTAVGTYDQSWGSEGTAPAVRSEPVEFEVVGVSDDEMRGYIHELGAMVPNSAGERLQRVADSLAFTGHSSAFGPLNDAMYQGAWPARRAYFYVADRDLYRESLLQSLNQRGPAEGMVWVLWVPLETPPERIAPLLAKAIYESIDPEIRARAARELSFPETGEAGMKPLLTAIEDDEPEVRAGAASALRFYEGEEATNAILAASTDRHPDVRMMAASSLAHRRPERAVPRLTEMLEDEREEVAQQAAGSLVDVGTPEAQEALREGLGVNSEAVRLRAALALLRLGDDSTRVILAQTLEQADERLRGSLMNSLGNAVERRKLTGPGENGRPHCRDVDAWLTWLREE